MNLNLFCPGYTVLQTSVLQKGILIPGIQLEDLSSLVIHLIYLMYREI